MANDKAEQRWGTGIPAESAEMARKHPTFVAGDSGLTIYRNAKLAACRLPGLYELGFPAGLHRCGLDAHPVGG